MASLSTPPPRHRRHVQIPSKGDPAAATGMTSVQQVDAVAVHQELTQAIEGEVRFGTTSLAMYANDSSNFRQIPIGVVVPRTTEDVVATHRVCSRHGAPILNRGGGTSLSGETVNYAVVIDHSKYLRHMGDVDTDRRVVTVEPGAINEKVNEHTGAQAHLVFGPDPSSHSRCAIGGNIGNNSCGIHSVQAQFYGDGPRTSDNVEALEIVTYDGERFWVGSNEEDDLDRIIAEGGRKGEIYRQLRDFRDRYADQIRAGFQPVDELPRRVSGYNLDELLPERGFNVARALVGTEGTCVTVLNATLKLIPELHERALVVVAFEDISHAGDAVPGIMERFRPIALEAIDHLLFEDEREQHMKKHGLDRLPSRPGDCAWLLVQFGSDDADDAREQAQEFVDWLAEETDVDHGSVGFYESEQLGGDTEAIWQVREGGLGATAFPPDGRDHWPGWEDSAVPPEVVGPYLRDLQDLYDRYGYRGAMYGHLGQGCVHSRISFDLRTAQGVKDYRAFMEEAADLVVSYHGSLSGEHGDGQQKAELLEKQYGPDLVQAMRDFKRIWDPQWKMNPGKVVDPFKLDEDLRLGTSYNPPRPDVKFAYEKDGGDFAHAALRCVGVGKCRNPDGDEVMCPSYQVTQEEEHTTRGRARLLFEMLQGDVITDGWQSMEVYDALDLCLSCKGCTNDCPVNVDMPTYKAEFLHKHFKSVRRWRPRYAYAFGFIDRASRIAARIPEIANAVTQTPGLSRLVKWVGGLDQQRDLPSFAPMTLQQWWQQRGGTRNPGGRRVVLWPDTFNNHLHTHVGVACVEAIEDAGWQVVIPEGHVCCGRPLYDYGFLDIAERYLHRVLDALRDEIRAGTPVVGMEPSCLAVFKDELTGILPHDDDAQRLAQQSYHFAEFFDTFDVEVPRIDGDALLWGHCHHRATGGIDPEQQVLQDGMGLEVESLSGGCCGLAGSWGFEDGKYDISMDCGEHAGLLPAVRDADDDTVVVADGFSCQTQIQQAGSGRRALHTAEVMQLARHHGSLDRADGSRRPEDVVPAERPAPPTATRVARTAAAAGLGLGLAAAAVAGTARLWDTVSG